ncbi:MAG: metalloregulator ArsR/SmtB family transcription factor [Verrucomicrobiota bacterium]
MVNDTAELNAVFSALSDPTRREILSVLMPGQRAVSDLAARFSISAPAISKHLRVLERAGLLSRHKRGRVHWISLEAEPLAEANQWIQQYQQFWESNLDALDQFLKDTVPDKSPATNHHP